MQTDQVTKRSSTGKQKQENPHVYNDLTLEPLMHFFFRMCHLNVIFSFKSWSCLHDGYNRAYLAQYKAHAEGHYEGNHFRPVLRATNKQCGGQHMDSVEVNM